MATIAQGGTIQIQSSSYGSLGHQTPSRAVLNDSHHQKLSLHIPSFHAIASLTFDLNRIIDNNFDLFYLTNHLKARNSLFLVLTLHTTL